MAIAQPAAQGFGAAADLYEARRPSYPAGAVTWLRTELGVEQSSLVVDLGAGTGKLTRHLAGMTLRLVAVEPVSAMCNQFRAALELPIAQAVAEALPLRSRSADAVVIAQAFHWFDFEPALAEMHRILRPEGGLGLIWNMRDERHDWVARLGDIRRRYGDIRYDSGVWRQALESSGLFGPLIAQRFDYHHGLTPEGVVELMASTSFIAALPREENLAVREELAHLLATHPETAGRERLVVPYRTDAYWTKATAPAA